VSIEAIREIADLLDLAPAEVHDTMTFYRFFRTDEAHKLGKTRLWVCQGLACQLRGCDDTLAKLCQRLHVAPGGTSSDGKITIEAAECIGACEGAPALLINDDARNGITEDKVDGLIEELRK
jgi:NADH-quinone oxidoreductase subunit E